MKPNRTAASQLTQSAAPGQRAKPARPKRDSEQGAAPATLGAWQRLASALSDPQSARESMMPRFASALGESAPGELRGFCALACLDNPALCAMLAPIFGRFDAPSPELAARPSERLLALRRLLGPSGAQRSKLDTLSALEAILQGAPASWLDQAHPELEGLRLLDWIAQRARHAGWMLSRLRDLGMSLSGAALLAVRHASADELPSRFLSPALAAGANPNGDMERAQDASPPLALALRQALCMELDFEFPRALIQAGAQLDARFGPAQETLAHMLCSVEAPSEQRAQAIEALGAAPALWRSTDLWGQTPAHRAARDPECWDWLTEPEIHQASMGAPDISGARPLDLAASVGGQKALLHWMEATRPRAWRVALMGAEPLPIPGAAPEDAPLAPLLALRQAHEKRARAPSDPLSLACLSWAAGFTPDALCEAAGAAAGQSAQHARERAERVLALLAEHQRELPDPSRLLLGRPPQAQALTRAQALSEIHLLLMMELNSEALSGRDPFALLLSLDADGSALTRALLALLDQAPNALAFPLNARAELGEPMSALPEERLEGIIWERPMSKKERLLNAGRDVAPGGKALQSLAPDRALHAEELMDWELREAWTRFCGAREPACALPHATSRLLQELSRGLDALMGRHAQTRWVAPGEALAKSEEPQPLAQEPQAGMEHESAGPALAWTLFTPESLAELEALADNQREPEMLNNFIRRQRHGRASGAGLSLGQRSLASCEPLMQAAAALRADFPHFEQALERILDHCALQRLGDGSLMLPPMLLVGAPGIGKTFFFERVAALVDTAYKIICMEGVTAGWVIRGSSPQWQDAQPGALFNLLAEGSRANPIILLDELDKVSADSRYAPDLALLPLLESATSRAFQDECIPLPLDARRVCWVATANELGPVAPALRSRLEVIHIPSPTFPQRRALAQAVYKRVLATHEWGAHFTEELSERLLDSLCSNPELGASRDLRRALINACARAARDGRLTLISSDLPGLGAADLAGSGRGSSPASSPAQLH